ncbi:MAG: hypothetical protein IJ713_09025 [Oscillibacter sp.]|nr:hypothetical protein [Oscillibacter sp.]
MTHPQGSRAAPAARETEEQGSGRSLRAHPETKASGLCDDGGHAENENNNRCDELAVAESRKFK